MSNSKRQWGPDGRSLSQRILIAVVKANGVTTGELFQTVESVFGASQLPTKFSQRLVCMEELGLIIGERPEGKANAEKVWRATKQTRRELKR